MFRNKFKTVQTPLKTTSSWWQAKVIHAIYILLHFGPQNRLELLQTWITYRKMLKMLFQPVLFNS